MLSLVDQVITEVADAITVADLWLNLESIYIIKSLTSKLLLKQRLFNLHMQKGTLFKDHMDQLNFIILYLCNIDIKVEDEDVALILIVSFPVTDRSFMESFVVGKYSFYLDEVRSTLHTREVRHKAFDSSADNLASRLVPNKEQGGKSEKKNFKKSKANNICNICNENGH